jgi:hypothetical protein
MDKDTALPLNIQEFELSDSLLMEQLLKVHFRPNHPIQAVSTIPVPALVLNVSNVVQLYPGRK